MRAVPASLVVAAFCLVALVIWDIEAAVRVLMLTLVAAPLADWFQRKAPRRAMDTAGRATSPHTIALSLWLPLQLALLAWALHAASTRTVQGIALAELMLFVGMTNGIFGMTVAHELLHRRGRTAHVVADVLLLTALYGHFRVSHLCVHHCLVATPADPATPAVGESLYTFFGRSIVEGFALSVQSEALRLAALGYRSCSLRNLVLRSILGGGAVIVTVGAIFGAVAAGLFVGQALIAVYTLEALNYVQHYGLSHRPAQSGSDTGLAWDWDGAFTNWLMLDLGAHNEHHGEQPSMTPANRPINPVHRLPGSYLLMIAVAACPPLWRTIMDRRVSWIRSPSSHAAAARPV